MTTTQYATTIIQSEAWYVENIKQKSGFHDVSRHIDTRKTKKALGIKGKVKKLKVFVQKIDDEAFDERANPQIVYKYDVCALPSHPLGKQTEWGFTATCPQGTAWVIV